MEADAGAGRPVSNDSSSEPNSGADKPSTEITAEDLDAVSAEDSSESEGAGDDVTAEPDADALSESEGVEDAADAPDGERIRTRLGRGWFVGIAATLLVLAGGVAAGGYLALRSHQDSQAIARHDGAAVEAAKNCVAATQAPDTRAMAASAQKMIDCGTGDYRSQAILYSSLLVDAYQVANAQVQVSDLRAAVERNNADGSIEVLVPLRVKVSNSATQNQEAGYRLRVLMVPDEGQYRIAKLDQVAK
jgi:Mce-associated membrane protein